MEIEIIPGSVRCVTFLVYFSLRVQYLNPGNHQPFGLIQSSQYHSTKPAVRSTKQ